jgi:hypothetical protein
MKKKQNYFNLLQIFLALKKKENGLKGAARGLGQRPPPPPPNPSPPSSSAWS